MSKPGPGPEMRRTIEELSVRAETALSRWGSKLRREVDPQPDAATLSMADRIVAEDKLRQQLTELEKELVLVTDEYEAKATAVRFWDERAAIAMRHSDAVTAKEAFEFHRRYVDELHESEREVGLLKHLVKKCRDALGG